MNNAKIWWLLGAVVVIGLVVYLMTMDRSDDPMMMGETENGQMVIDESSPRSLKQLMESDRPVTCGFSDSADGTASQGTVYVAGENFRADFTMTENETTTTGHVIRADNMIYTWMQGSSEGFKMSAEMEADYDYEESDPAAKSLDPEKKIDYDCETWSGDRSMFDVPAEVEFKDLTSMMPPAMGVGAETTTEVSGTADLKAMQCAACDAAPGDARTQCRTSLGCN